MEYKEVMMCCNESKEKRKKKKEKRKRKKPQRRIELLTFRLLSECSTD